MATAIGANGSLVKEPLDPNGQIDFVDWKAAKLAVSNLNQHVVNAEYAVRGPLLTRAKELENEMAQGKEFGFKQIVYCNIGNPHQLMQPTINFGRQIVSLVEMPSLLNDERILTAFSPDAVTRAREFMDHVPGGMGCYSDSKGVPYLRQRIAAGLERRDGYPADPETIFLTNGASLGVSYLLEMILRSPEDAIMCPIPQYPLYSATITLLGGTLVPYYLEEDKGWAIDMGDLREQLLAARRGGKLVRALVCINPGNPTGQVLPESNMREVAQLCADENIMLIADEVYQENVYAPGKRWVSFKKIVGDMGLLGRVQLASLHSTSKGFYGECGHRGGLLELSGIHPDVVNILYKLCSLTLCSNTVGQVLMAAVLQPPSAGDAAFESFDRERGNVLASLARRARVVTDELNKLEGVTCNAVEGALYAFPRIRLPARAVEAAEAAGVPADAFYCAGLLEEQGIVVVPGSGFGQRPGTLHFRTTILPAEGQMAEVMQRLATFHQGFMDKYRDAAEMNGHH
eukprot:jgi/Mesvir1/6181/Mv00869-RA.1